MLKNSKYTIIKRRLSFLLALVLMISCMSVSVSAEDTETLSQGSETAGRDLQQDLHAGEEYAEAFDKTGPDSGADLTTSEEETASQDPGDVTGESSPAEKEDIVITGDSPKSYGSVLLRKGAVCTELSSYQEWDQPNSLPDVGEWILTNDVVMSYPWDLVGKSVALCLNGHTISFEYKNSALWAQSNYSNDYAINIYGGAALSIYDHTGSGRIQGDKLHSLINVNKGVLNLYAGTLTGGAGGVYLNSANGAFNFYGGSITGNDGGSSVNFGGIYVGGGSFSVSGLVSVTGNYANDVPRNVYLRENSVISLAGSLDEGSRFGITTELYPQQTPIIVSSGLFGKGQITSFVPDSERCVTGMSRKGEAVLGLPSVITFSPGEAGGSMESVRTATGGVYELPMHSFIAPPGKIFDGWKVSYTNEVMDPYQTIVITGNVTLTAMWKTGSGPITQHVHQWQFVIDENTDPGYAQVCCNAPDLSGGECAYQEDSSKWIRLKVTPEELTYNGSSGFSAEIEKQPFDPTNFIEGFPEEDEIRVGGISWFSMNGESVPYPVDAGNYFARCELQAVNEPNNSAYLRTYVSVLKAPAPAITVTGFLDLPLTGQPQELVSAAPADIGEKGTMWYRLGEDGEWTTEIPRASESGEYTVYWCFISDNYENVGDKVYHPNSVSASVSYQHDHDDIRFTQWSSTTSLPAEPGSYFLKNDVSLTSDWSVTGNVRLCLNGRTISGEHQIRVRNGGTLTLYADDGGTLSGLYGSDGAVLIDQGGTLTTLGVDMTSLNAAGQNCGAVNVKGIFNMTDGSITGCAAPHGGVCVNGGSFNVSGKIVITGSTDGSGSANNQINVFLPAGNHITLAGQLTQGTSIGVRTKYNEYDGVMPKPGEEIVLTENYGTYMGQADPSDFISLDYAYTSPHYVIAINADGEAVLALHRHSYTLTADEEEDTITVSCGNPYCDYEGEAVFTLTAEDAVYDHDPHPAEVVITPSKPDGIIYGLAYFDENGNPAVIDQYYLSPVNLGTYVAKLTVTADDNSGSSVCVEKTYSIYEPEVQLPDASVTAVPRNDLVHTGGLQTLVDFTDWTPEDVQYVAFRVDNGSWSYHYKERPANFPASWTNPEPQAAAAGTHTVYYYIPQNYEKTYNAYGSMEEPFSVQVTIRPRYTVSFDKGWANNDAQNPDPVYLIPEEGNVFYYTVPENADLKYNGSPMIGWVNKGIPENERELYLPDTTIPVSGNITLLAKWGLDLCNITVNPTQYGTVTPSKTRAYQTERITLTIEPDEGYILDSLTLVRTNSSNTDPIVLDENNSFLLPTNVTVKASFMKDLADGYYLIGPDWSRSAIEPGQKFEEDENGVFSLYADIAEGQKIGAVRIDSQQISAIYPSETETVYTVDAAHAGKVRIFFSETYKEDWAGFGGHIFIEKQYTVTCLSAGNGRVSSSAAFGPEGAQVVLTVTPDEDCILGSLKVTDASGAEIEVTDNTFYLGTSDVTVSASFGYPLWIGSVMVSSVNQENVLLDGSVSFDPEKRELTIDPDNLTIPGTHADALIYTDLDKLLITSDKEVSLSSDEARYAVYARKLMVNADLSISLGARNAQYAVYTNESVFGGNVRVLNPSGSGIYVGSGSAAIDGDFTARVASNGVYALNGISLGGRADITSGGTGLNVSSYSGAITVLGDLVVTSAERALLCGGSVTVEGDTTIVYTGTSGYAIWAGYGNGNNASAVFRGKLKVDAETNDYAAACRNLTLGKKAEITNRSGGGLNVLGSLRADQDVDIHAKMTGINCSDTVSIGGDLRAEGAFINGYGVFAGSGFTAGGDVRIKDTGSSGQGIYASGGAVSVAGDLELTTGKNCIVTYGSTLTIGGSARMTTTGTANYAVYIPANTDLTIGGDLTLGGTASSAGIFAGGSVSAEGSVKVDLNARDGIFSGKTIRVSRGIWDISAGTCAMRAKEGIVIPDAYAVTMPENGQVKETTINSEQWYTITGPESDAAAKHIRIEPVSVQPSFKKQSLLLSGQIGVNFYMDLPAIDGVDYSESYMSFKITGNGPITDTDYYDPQHMNKSGEYYGFTCYVNSVQMADIITATFHYGNDQYVEKTYSIKEYMDTFDTVIQEAPDAFDDKTIALIHSLADYGHYVQPFLSHARNWTIGTDYAEMDKYYTSSYDVNKIKEDVSDYAAFKQLSGDMEKITYSLLLDTDTGICVYFKPVNGYNGNLSFKLDGTSVTAEKIGDRYMVQVPGISAHLLGTSHTINAQTESGTSEIRVSALSYIYSLLAAQAYQNDEEARYAVSALYRYFEAAYNYKNP